ncbi:MAG: lytic transglycosylase domain-containing protein [Acidobacteriota bacterium]
MKSVISLTAFALLLAAGEAQGQEARISINADSIADTSQLLRTPAMIVHEIAIPVQKPVADPARGPAAGLKNGSKAPSSAAATTAQGPIVVQPPIFMPGTPSSSVAPEMNTTGNPKYNELIAKSATRNGIDPNLMVAVMRQESGFNPRARSYKGATGLMQLMPATAARFGVTNIYDVAQNIEGGAKYLRFLSDTFNGDVELMLAGYNAGEHAVMNSGYRVPRYRETQNYVKSISARYDRARSRAAGSPRIAAVAVAPSAETFANGRLSNNY